MTHKPDTLRFAYHLVCDYAKFNKLDNCFVLSIDDIPSIEQQELSYLLVAEDLSYASEVTGPDNPYFHSKMLPALLRLLSNSTDKDNEIEFVSSWKDGVTNYLRDAMQQLLSDKLHEYNQDHGYVNKQDYASYRYNGERHNLWRT